MGPLERIRQLLTESILLSVIGGAIGLLLALIALVATLLPAWRATLVDPTVALREE